jgi:murein DD-endopeptidase MepM/ murein hydrolase activator NlpD
MLSLLVVLLASFDVMALPRARTPTRIEVVELAPVFQQPFVCGEHPEGSLHYVGDALGRDCVITGGLDPVTSEGYPRPFRGDGAKNSDWYGFHAEVHAPFDGVVEGVHDNPVENEPGHPSKQLAGFIAFRRSDGLQVTYAHTTQPTVKVGDRVHAGQVVALVGDNGHARMPHIHIGAWRGTTPYQIRWDLRAAGRVPALQHQ